MPIQIEEPTRASLVVLNAHVPIDLRQGLIGSLSSASPNRLVSATNPVEGDVLSFLSERINVKLNVNPNRVTVEKEHPFDTQGWARLSEIAEIVIHHFAPIAPIGGAPITEGLHTFGFNIEAICRADANRPANAFLTDGFFNLGGLKSSGFEPVEGSFQVTVSDGHNRYWKIRVEPLVGATEAYSFFVALNLHSQNMKLPTTKQEIETAFNATWSSIEAIIGSLEVTR